MTRVCTVCTHPERLEIDRMLVNRELSYRGIARQYALSQAAVSRHVNSGHIAELLAKGHEAEEMAEADKLLTDIRKIQGRTLLMLGKAEKSGDLRTALAAVSQARQNIALLTEMCGQLDRRPQLNLVLSPEWLELRALIVGALEPHPEAKAAVVRAIASKESNGSG